MAKIQECEKCSQDGKSGDGADLEGLVLLFLRDIMWDECINSMKMLLSHKKDAVQEMPVPPDKLWAQICVLFSTELPFSQLNSLASPCLHWLVASPCLSLPQTSPHPTKRAGVSMCWLTEC